MNKRNKEKQRIWTLPVSNKCEGDDEDWKFGSYDEERSPTEPEIVNQHAGEGWTNASSKRKSRNPDDVILLSNWIVGILEKKSDWTKKSSWYFWKFVHPETGRVDFASGYLIKSSFMA